MKRTLLLTGLALVVGWTLPAWADHSAGTGINCSNFAFQEDAQAYFNQHPGDPEGLDGPPGAGFTGVQNVACEDLPRRGSTTTIATIPTSTTTTVAAVDTRPSSGNSGAASDATAQPLAAANQTATTVTTIPVTTATTVPAAPAPATASAARPLALTG